MSIKEREIIIVVAIQEANESVSDFTGTDWHVISRRSLSIVRSIIVQLL